jgi:hypothetical protein
LEQFDIVLSLHPESISSTPSSGRWRLIKLLAKTFEEPIIQLPSSTLEYYDEVARSVVSYMSPIATRSVVIVSGTRDYTAVTAYEVLKLMESLKTFPHTHLILDLDFGSLGKIDKINMASLVGRLMSSNRFSIIPFSISKVMGYSTKLGQSDYVERCLARVLSRFFRDPIAGAYIPVCLSLEPASVFRDAASAVDLAFYAYTGLHRAPLNNAVFGTVRVWKGMKERLGTLGEVAGGRLTLEYLEDDRIEVEALVRYGILSVLTEGVEIIREVAHTGEAVVIATRLARLQDRMVGV